MSGAFWGRWDLAARSRKDGLSSAMRMPWKSSKARLGLRLKKSPEREASDCIHRRVGHQRTPHSRAHVGTERANAGDSVSFQLETSVRDCRTDPNELSVPLTRRQHQEGTNRRVSQGAQGAFEAAAADHPGRTPGAQIEAGARIS